ncbi:hypothetical protein CKM354_000573200 [Cercospora kikuchii]|uniref:RRM domain-containing protein n=1 Tax=Cercospora kikuchii TaxID=84275 RepID=A0A9P3CFV5_9PEZI|nr:uncharacterized protein CKM354_000573200 [Cercospora kikuchii]GIZ42462.1 hypothetical protein CKM354_000573200 [Cercospora kikuchii]
MSRENMSSSDIKAEKKKKRKRAEKAEAEEELEIDVNLPEPPSKKAKRKEKKAKSKPAATENTDAAKDENATTKTQEDNIHPSRSLQVPVAKGEEAGKRSDYGVWIGNLSFKTTKETLRRFFLDRGGIDETSITRLHLPVDHNTKQNKGFAYVDFTTEAVLNIAITCTEKLLDGRKVLIKNAKSFEGRPAKTKAEEDAAKHGNISTKAPSKRVFVGNLSFDITKDELAEHFAQAGTVEDVFLATFEDSGKCKGFGWVTFADIEAAEKAVKGFIYKEQQQDDDEDSEAADSGKEKEKGSDSDSEEYTAEQKKRHAKKKKKPMKWFINRIHGRMMKLEFAEDKQTRYQKRYGKGSGGAAKRHGEEQAGNGAEEESIEALAAQAAAARDAPREKSNKKRDPNLKKMNKDERQELRRKKHDARLTAPGAALAKAQRSDKASGTAVAGTGKKISFD